MILNLSKCPVCFNQEAHTYRLGKKELSGVTSMLKKMLFADKYSDVPKQILDKACAYGTSVHEGVELYVVSKGAMHDGSQEVSNFVKLMEQEHLTPYTSEYLVSDLDAIASSIDLVLTDEDDEIILADIKTTSGGLDEEYLSWQLSVYAYLFEKQNEGLKVKGLKGVWLRHNESHIKDIQRKSDADVYGLIYAFAHGLEVAHIEQEESTPPAEIAELVAEVEELEKKKKALQLELDLKSFQLCCKMQELGCDKVEGELFCITYIHPTSRKSFDSATFKRDNPDLYDRYMVERSVKESLSIREKKS